VTKDLVRAARFLVLPTAALVAVAAFAPGRVELAARVYALLLAATALVLAIAALRRAYPRTRPLRPHTAGSPARPRRPAVLARMEHEAALGVASSFDLHHRLRPRLRRLASELLAVRRGIALDGDPERARSALGEPTWELVRADRPVPDDRQARGIPISDLHAVVESLERI
jgi:hypothetical protein